jgi:putative membrane-bound dehydrogenase-like protein
VFTRPLRFAAILFFGLLRVSGFAADDGSVQVGVARVDITPDRPIRLTGYAIRKTESDGVEQRLWAKALAFGSDADGPAVLITVDNCGVSALVIDEVAGRLKKKITLPRERLAVCSSHTHSGPCVLGFAPNIFAMPVPADQQATIERYTRELTDKLERVALAALADRQPSRLGWNLGRVAFARNRRTAGGPVDQALPLLCVTSPTGRTRAVLANYACHCTTLGGEFNRLCGDWAGYAQEAIETDFPGAVALIAIGCGADANPSPRGGADGGLALARQHGRELADEVKRLLGGHLTPITRKPSCRARRFDLPFDTLPTRAQWEERAKQDGIVGYHAKRNLERLDRGESLPTTLPYIVSTWNFGDELAMVFLAGEVVVDYSLRLKKELDADRLWINAYAHDVPCYIPSRRVLQEGGYEAETSLWYYDRPARLAPAAEDFIVGAVRELLPREFAADPKKAEFQPPKTPAEALAAFRVQAGLAIDVAAVEPLVVDPVAIDWSADGRFWVVEMRDYPTGIDGHWKAGGRVKVLEDVDGDGKYHKATVFLDGLPFPTGITAWGKGVLVCAAPDILYAEDTNRDGKADVVKKIFSGFATNNYQARVNSLSPGLDNWIYGANGLIGGRIHGRADGREVDISGRDFRMHPGTGEFEAASGLSQQGRVRDDWDNWFGCDNSTLLWHFPLPEQYLRRNPFFAPPEPRVFVPADPDPNLLFPTSRILERFNDPGAAGRTTSACGLGIYRDDWLGEAFNGNAFVCEPVHNLVHRLILTPEGVSFRGHRPPTEQQTEFLTSKDNWFRPVQARTGPDGALWIVDMYRFVVEHPRWIPPERLARLNVRAGDDKGRIYRVHPAGKAPRPIRDLTRLPTRELAGALATPNGTERDRVQLELLRRGDPTALPPLIQLLKSGEPPGARLQALCTVDGLGGLTPDLLEDALADARPELRRHAIRLSEPFLSKSAKSPGNTLPRASQVAANEAHPAHLAAALLQLVNDPDPTVRYQLALSLGEWADPRAGETLGRLAQVGLEDPWMRAAVLSSARRFPAAILLNVLGASPDSPARKEMINQVLATAVGSDDPEALGLAMTAIAPAGGKSVESWQLAALGGLLDALSRKGQDLETLASSANPLVRPALARARLAIAQARDVARDEAADPAGRVGAISLLARNRPQLDGDVDLLGELLAGSAPPAVQSAALSALGRTRSPKVPAILLSDWPHRSPALRTRILGALLARDEWIGDLLDAVARGLIAPSEIPPANRQRLLKHKNEALARRAAGLLAAGQSASRAEVMAKYRDAITLTGDPGHGRPVFATNCASCHAIGGAGHAVGPDLTAFRTKSPQDFLVAILDPSAAIEPRFINYQVETKDGRSLSGVVKAETASSLTLVQGGGLEETILRNDIAEIRASNLSLMPEGLEQNMTPQDLADLIAYLKNSGPRPFGGATATESAAALGEFLKSGPGAVARIVSAAGQLPYPGWLGRLPMPFCRQSDGQSKLVWESLPARNDMKPTETERFRLPAAMGFLSQPSGTFQLLVNGTPALEFNVTLTSQEWQDRHGRVRMRYDVLENNDEDSDGILQIDVSGSLLEPGKPTRFEVVGSAAGSQRWFGLYLLPERGASR